MSIRNWDWKSIAIATCVEFALAGIGLCVVLTLILLGYLVGCWISIGLC
jgi:hypothetical protein